jgi:hypothetical protein
MFLFEPFCIISQRLSPKCGSEELFPVHFWLNWIFKVRPIVDHNRFFAQNGRLVRNWINYDGASSLL